MTVADPALLALMRKCLAYDPDTGRWTWIVDRKGVHAGDEAGTSDGDGYRIIRLGGRGYRAHRLAWLWMTGAWPPDEIDHVNGERSDNRFVNLRPATKAQNKHNRKQDLRSTSPFKGVMKGRWGKWRVRVCVGYKRHCLGGFSTAEEAFAARHDLARRLHGSYARDM